MLFKTFRIHNAVGPKVFIVIIVRNPYFYRLSVFIPIFYMINKAFTPLILIVSMLMFSCGQEDPQDDNISISQTAIEIDYEETFRLDATFIRDGYSPTGFIWESANPDIAAVRNDGTVTGLRVGTTIVTVYTADRLFSADCEVTVLPTNLLYQDPLLNFNESKAFIKANENRRLLDEDDEFLLYQGENNNIIGLAYLFENTFYDYSLVILNPETNEYLDNLWDFLEQRYELVVLTEEFALFENEHVLVILTIDEQLGLIAIYIENDETTEASAKNMKINNLIDKKLIDAAKIGSKLDIRPDLIRKIKR